MDVLSSWISKYIRSFSLYSGLSLFSCVTFFFFCLFWSFFSCRFSLYAWWSLVICDKEPPRYPQWRHHQLNGHEFEQAPGVSDGQESLACCSPWGHKESDTTEWQNWGILNYIVSSLHFSLVEIWPRNSSWIKIGYINWKASVGIGSQLSVYISKRLLPRKMNVPN